MKQIERERCVPAFIMSSKTPSRVGALSVVLAVTLAGCGKRESAESAGDPKSQLEKVTEGARDAVASTKEFFLEQKERLQKNLSGRLSELEKQLEELKAKSTQASEKTKGELARTVSSLQKKKDAAAQKLEQLKSASAQAWQDIKA